MVNGSNLSEAILLQIVGLLEVEYILVGEWGNSFNKVHMIGAPQK